ncbi:MAG: NADH-quinone oxidoreductase subunit L, partial [Pseudomonadota bacterium]
MPTIILFAPLFGALICGFAWRAIGERAALMTATGLLFLSAFLSWIVFLTFSGEAQTIPLFRWIHSGTMEVDWAIRLDMLTA